MVNIDYAVVVFRDESGNIAVQKRGANSKSGESFTLWGGKFEGKETPGQAIARELMEELGYVPEDLQFFGECVYEYKNETGEKVSNKYYVFVSAITDTLKSTEVLEGEGVVTMPISEVETNNFFEGDKYLINSLFLNQNSLS